MASLEGKVALVTGGASGIGAGICRYFVGSGATVVVADVDEELGDRATFQEIVVDGGLSLGRAWPDDIRAYATKGSSRSAR